MSTHSKTEMLKITLEDLFKRDIDLVIKDNRSTFLSAKYFFGKKMKIHLHRAFLDAPYFVLISLREYLLKNRKMGLKNIRNFMELFYQKNDYSENLNKDKIKPVGKTYNLKDIFDNLNKKYFDDSLDINISWFKKPKYKKNRSITFGSYERGLKLIKINEILDNDFFPPYFVSFVVFHEILHHQYPTIIDEKGRRKMHYKEFKNAEAEFEYFEEALDFEKHFLKKRRVYVRT
jgi:hypothetical protein